jgi:hypothetical protein
MTTLPSAAREGIVRTVTPWEGAERRAWVRHPYSWRLRLWPAAARGLVSWGVGLVNLSAGGAGLLLSLARPPKELSLSLPGLAAPRRARVVHLTPRRTAGWLLGCQFHQPLSDAELLAVLLGRRTGEGDCRRMVPMKG